MPEGGGTFFRMPDFLQIWPKGTPLGGGQPAPNPVYPQAPTSTPRGEARTHTAAHPLSGHRLVAVHGNRVRYPSRAACDAYTVVGITTHAAEQGAEVEVAGTGEIVTEPSWNLVPDQPVYAGESGRLTQTPPTSGWLRIVGVAQSTISLVVSLQVPIHL